MQASAAEAKAFREAREAAAKCEEKNEPAGASRRLHAIGDVDEMETRASDGKISRISAASDEEGWIDAWQARLGCWWGGLPAPTQHQMGACMGALALHVGSRLDSFLTQAGLPPAAPKPQLSAESGCEWLDDRLYNEFRPP